MNSEFSRYVRAEDFGTPARTSKETVSLTVDGVDVTVPKGTTGLIEIAEATIRELARNEKYAA